jgi:hypothetical protein
MVCLAEFWGRGGKLKEERVVLMEGVMKAAAADALAQVAARWVESQQLQGLVWRGRGAACPARRLDLHESGGGLSGGLGSRRCLAAARHERGLYAAFCSPGGCCGCC